MITEIKRAMRRLTPLELATRELADAELQKLTAQSAQEYAACIASYNTSRIARLRAFIASQTKEEVQL